MFIVRFDLSLTLRRVSLDAKSLLHGVCSRPPVSVTRGFVLVVELMVVSAASQVHPQ